MVVMVVVRRWKECSRLNRIRILVVVVVDVVVDVVGGGGDDDSGLSVAREMKRRLLRFDRGILSSWYRERERERGCSVFFRV